MGVPSSFTSNLYSRGGPPDSSDKIWIPRFHAEATPSVPEHGGRQKRIFESLAYIGVPTEWHSQEVSFGAVQPIFIPPSGAVP
jgi:hypothetical protein